MTLQQELGLEIYWANLRSSQRTEGRIALLAAHFGFTVEDLSALFAGDRCRQKVQAADATRSFAADRVDGSPDPDLASWRPR